MTITTIKRIFKLGLVNFWRNRWLSLASSLMIMLTLLTMGIFVIMNIFINSTAEGIKDRIDLSIYFYENATETQIKDLQFTLANRSDVKTVKYISKDEAYILWQQRAINPKVKNLITKDQNPLPRSLQIKANNPESLETIATVLGAERYQPYVREVSYQKTKVTIDKLINLTGFIRSMGFVVSIFLFVISLVVIMNTIRLTIFTRRDEIEVMRLVGANSIFIRVPFSFEAVLYGALGSFLAYLIIVLLMTYFGPRLAGYFADIANSTSTPYFYLIQPYFEIASAGVKLPFFHSFIALWQLGAMQAAIGIFFAVSCSLIALRRYLHV